MRRLHVDGAGRPAQRAEEREHQADRLLQRRCGDRIDQHGEPGDAEREPGADPGVEALAQDEPGHQAGPDRHRIVDDDHPRGGGAELGEGAEQAERHHVEHSGDEDVEPVAAERNVQAAALQLEQDEQRRRADAVAEQAHGPRRDLVERDAQRRPAQPPAEASRTSSSLPLVASSNPGFEATMHLAGIGER